MESKLYEECHEGGGFMAEQAMLKQDETVRTQIPTMKPVDWEDAVISTVHGPVKTKKITIYDTFTTKEKRSPML